MSRWLSFSCAAACLSVWSAGEASSWAADETPSVAPSPPPPAAAPAAAAPPSPEPAASPPGATPATEVATDPAPAVLPATAPATSGDASAVDAALRRALAPRCGEAGPLLRQASLSASAEDRALVERVLRLCASLPTELASSGAANEPPVATAPDRSGRGRLIIGTTVYGLWVGIAVDVLLEVDDARTAVLPPLLGVGAGLTASLLATQEGEITRGQAWTIITGLDYGTYSGLLLAGALDITGDPKAIVGSALATGLVGGTAATLVATNFRPTPGDAEVVRSGGLWGFASMGLLALAFQPEEEQTTFAMLLAGMDGGLATGAIIAHANPISRDRMLIGDAGALAGAVAGFGLGTLIIGTPDDDEGRGLAVTTLVGLHAGLGLSFWLTRNMADEKARNPEDEEARATPEHEPPAALWVRNERGAWHSGRVALQPTFDTTGPGLRPVGAWLPLLGGLW